MACLLHRAAIMIECYMIKLQFKWIVVFDEITVEIMQYESMLLWLLVCPSMEAEYCDECGVPVSHVCMHITCVCLFACLSQESHVQTSPNFICIYLRHNPVFLPLAASWCVMDDSCRVCTGPGIDLGDAKSALCRPVFRLHTELTLWCCVYTKPDSTKDSIRPRGGSTGEGEGGYPPAPRRLLTKNRDASLGDKTYVWSAWRRQADQSRQADQTQV